jgi:hypothetical protein
MASDVLTLKLPLPNFSGFGPGMAHAKKIVRKGKVTSQMFHDEPVFKRATAVSARSGLSVERKNTLIDTIWRMMTGGTEIARITVPKLKGLDQPTTGCIERTMRWAKNMLTTNITAALFKWKVSKSYLKR